MRIMKNHISRTVLIVTRSLITTTCCIGAFVVNTSFGDDALNNQTYHRRTATWTQLMTEDGSTALTASGLQWDPTLRILVGVGDNRKAAPGYEIFALAPERIGPGKPAARATPLLSVAQSQELQLDDVEGITRDESGLFTAICSLSLDDAPSAPDDRWTRFQGVTFRITKGPDGRVLLSGRPRQLSKSRRPDIREWLISSSGRSWAFEEYAGRPASTGDVQDRGIDVEGLATGPGGELMIGLRGPLDSGSSDAALVLPVMVSGNRPDDPNRDGLTAAGWMRIDTRHLSGSSQQKRRGIRGVDRIPGTDKEYVLVLGHTGPRIDPFRLAIWRPDELTPTTRLVEKAELPIRHAVEGVTVTEITRTGTIRLCIASETGGMMWKDISR